MSRAIWGESGLFAAKVKPVAGGAPTGQPAGVLPVYRQQRAGGPWSSGSQYACAQGPYAGEVLVGGLRGKALFGRERGHRRLGAACEQGPDNGCCLRTGASSEIRWCRPCCEGDLQAAPDVGDVGALTPDACGKALEHQDAYFISERQGCPEHGTVEPAQLEAHDHWRTGQCVGEPRDLGAHEVLADHNVLARPAGVSGNEDVDDGPRVDCMPASYFHRHASHGTGEPVALHLVITPCLQPVN